jgi:hypothetical protein
MDMLPLQAEYFSKNSDKLEDDKILFYSADAYSSWQDNRYPICYILAKGSVYKEIVNPFNFSEEDLIQAFITPYLEEKSSILSELFSDESLLRWLLLQWKQPQRIQKLNRGWIRGVANNRIDRVNFGFHPQRLKEGYYIDCHMPRPLSKYQAAMNPIFNYLKIEKSKI